MNLLTEKSRIAWLVWKAQSSKDWRPGLDAPDFDAKFDKQLAELLDTPERQAWAPWIRRVVAHPPTGTINCLALNEKGEMSGVTTTSGLAWKISGRCGDSPIIGAGLFLDQDVGGAGSTGTRRGRHQDCGRAHRGGNDAARNIADGCVHGGAASRGAQL